MILQIVALTARLVKMEMMESLTKVHKKPVGYRKKLVLRSIKMT